MRAHTGAPVAKILKKKLMAYTLRHPQADVAGSVLSIGNKFLSKLETSLGLLN